MLDMFRSFTALQVIFEIGFIPRPEDLEEFSAEDYIQANNGQEMGLDTKERWFKILPPGRFFEEDIYQDSEMPAAILDHEVPVLSESECEYLWTAVRFIDEACAKSKQALTTDMEKLHYLSKLVPSVISASFVKRHGTSG